MSVSKKVTIVVATYNQGKYISRCLRSLLNQTFEKNLYEIVVIDDCSTDNTSSVLKNFSNEITVLKNNKNQGLAASLNVAIKKCKTPYIIRVDSDDYVNENFILFLRTFIEENPNYDAVACDYYLVDEKENILDRCDCKKNPIACGIIFRLDQLIQIGLYDTKFRLYEDKDLRKRFLKKFKITRLPLPLYRYRRHISNITNDHISKKKFSKLLRKKKY